MRIGVDGRVLVDQRMRGLKRYTVNLIRALSARDDIEVTIVAPEGPPWPEDVLGLQAEFVTFPATRELAWATVSLPRALRQLRIDVFHAPADRGLPFRKPCPLVVTVHDSYEREHWRTLLPSLRQRSYYWTNELVNYVLADAILTVSSTTATDLRRLRVGRKRRIRHTYLAASPEFSSEALLTDPETRKRYGVEGPYVLFVGGYDERKNVESLVHAFDRLGESPLQLVLLADHQWRFHDLRLQWQELRCFSRLRCLEVDSDDLPAFYRGARVCVVPSMWESFGLPLVEAMASGTPVIASTAKALPEVGGDGALYVAPGDVPGLSSAIALVLADPELHAELRRRGLQRSSEYSWERTAGQTVDVYQAIARDGRLSRGQDPS